MASKIKKWVEKQGGKAYKYPGSSGHAHAGFPDLICVMPRVTVFVETKVPGGEPPSAIQFATIKEINAAGGNAFWTDSLESFIHSLSTCKD